MRYPVACELDVLVFQQVDSGEVADGVVFEFDAVGDGVYHLLAFEDLDALAAVLLVEVLAQFQAVVLAHWCGLL